MVNDQKYIETFLEPIEKSRLYKPKFGNAAQVEGYTLAQFHELYGSDPFYAWIGLNSDLMYAAHKAAGGMTSVYRQIGIGCERLFREIIIDRTEYRDRQLATWSYSAKTKAGKSKTLSLDGRLECSEIKNTKVKQAVETWITSYCENLNEVSPPKNGVVFEVRQGYKSKDSKRQNADIDNATVAWANGYMPVFAIFSSQIDLDIVIRYQNNRCGILTGINNTDDNISLFAFCKNVLGYDLAGFFERNSGELKECVESVISSLLSAE
ncbi:MAG: hypothetical protein ACO3NK_01265 [Prochlorotrichaceae cyanobacterium]